MKDEKKTKSVTIELKREDMDLFTIHDASKAIMKLDRKAPDFEFKMQAAIKRMIHWEKAHLYSRMRWYTKMDKDEPCMKSIRQHIEDKLETHDAMYKMSDEKIITWDVATHKWKDHQWK